MLEHGPDAEWRLIFALCRFGGLRCPSELLCLEGSDVLWDRDRIRIHSPKKEADEQGGDRFIPIFPELRPYLVVQKANGPVEWMSTAIVGAFMVVAITAFSTRSPIKFHPDCPDRLTFLSNNLDF